MGVPVDANRGEIKKAYHRLVMEYHPDRNRDAPGCEERLKEINEAYQVLGDEGERRRYDLLKQKPFIRPVYYQEDLGEDLIEILKIFSGRGFGMRGAWRCRGSGLGRKCRRWSVRL